MEFTYGVMHGILGLACTGLAVSATATNNSTLPSVEVSKIINRTKHVYSSTTEFTYEKYVDNREAISNKSQEPHHARGIQGMHMMMIFLLYGFLITLGWGGITVLMMAALRIGLGKSPHRAVQYLNPQRAIQSYWLMFLQARVISSSQPM
jgi:hypothetical protein